MKRTRRTYSRDYKLAAVKKVIEQGLSYAEVARDLGIGDTLIHTGERRLRPTERFRPRSLKAHRSRPNSSDCAKRIVSSRWNETF